MPGNILTYSNWILKAYQTIYLLTVQDFEIIPGNILSYDKINLKSYQAIYLLTVQDFEIIPGNIHSYDIGFWDKTGQCTFLWQRILKSYRAISATVPLGTLSVSSPNCFSFKFVFLFSVPLVLWSADCGSAGCCRWSFYCSFRDPHTPTRYPGMVYFSNLASKIHLGNSIVFRTSKKPQNGPKGHQNPPKWTSFVWF